MGVYVATYENPVVLKTSNMYFYPSLSAMKSIFPLRKLAETAEHILLDWNDCFEVAEAFQGPSNVGGICEHFSAFVVDKIHDRIMTAPHIGGVLAKFLSIRVTQADGSIRMVGDECTEPEETNKEYGCVSSGGGGHFAKRKYSNKKKNCDNLLSNVSFPHTVLILGFSVNI